MNLSFYCTIFRNHTYGNPDKGKSFFLKANAIFGLLLTCRINLLPSLDIVRQWGAFYLFIAEFFATYNIGGAKELVVHL